MSTQPEEFEHRRYGLKRVISRSLAHEHVGLELRALHTAIDTFYAGATDDNYRIDLGTFRIETTTRDISGQPLPWVELRISAQAKPITHKSNPHVVDKPVDKL